MKLIRNTGESSSYNYPDKLLRIISYPILAFVIRSFGEITPIGQLLKTKLYYADLFWNFLIVAISWEANRLLIRYLDHKYPWEKNKLFRFVIQISTALPMTVILVVPMIYLWNGVIITRGGFDPANLLTNDFILIVVFTGMVHMIYTFLYFRNHYKVQIENLQSKLLEIEMQLKAIKSGKETSLSPLTKKTLIVQYGKSAEPLLFDEIAYIYKINDLGCIKTFSGKEYSTATPLDQLESELGNESFFRINRQWLGNIKAIKRYTIDPSGRLILELSPISPSEVLVSKKRALEFKSWIGKKV